ncbi:Rpn family recombination-promoting nuclease/putative transposase [Halomonas sp. McH1-25]|uniref:Rpn family recombination-promoting nuclease/putative transposase n=1 Tax=unclassified Halomonas TaxID=2609666 RepID=UPI001EF4693D|nr:MULTISPECIES: Rpn family recombination-promoting nuclease/putative transposase [unclassified Halomonas]MCG7602195.1 Rpn family recombination-promoting nuclease/putative transposase [Halomonas sp. McH1-25]MCP1344476.1 Rpn family recombination-promoting nuclease/putative transposase [Halomonas sp. FL8]MCP1362797.1 Rpn family recombination-promoting nuclease/putative transposase [Halomonas sp. BBD45]MCP1365845.1 Rpn family recombination-promoting nuclease/putative transposase [Halomonas sp. BBD
MVSNHHDTGYKELFSYPEFVQQLIEGFAPPDIAGLMDFSTLKNHSGHYITPLFEEKIEDVVWSVEVTWEGVTQRVFLYILLEFQSSVDRTMPIRLMHYVACFYNELLKQKVITPGQGLPPVFSVVLYNGSKPWTAPLDIYEMVQPELPGFLQVYQPHLRYYLVDEGRYTDADLGLRQTPLSGVFSVENAGESWEALQLAVDRVVAIIQADPNKERTDRIITRWLKRHLNRLGAGVNLERLESLVEDKDMLAENLENLVKKERLEGRQEGRQEEAQRILRKQINLKFSDLPEWAEQRLEQATPEQLEDWSAAILTANSLDELFMH